jgi:hypothetical protein
MEGVGIGVGVADVVGVGVTFTVIVTPLFLHACESLAFKYLSRIKF